MESSPSTAPSTGRHRARDRRRNLGLRVLIVEDDAQVSDVLSELMESEGFEVALAGTAQAGLEQLSSDRFHLLITDYWLPDRTGAWMLSEAAGAGLLPGTQVLVITGEHRPQGVENQVVLRKPLDLDDFLRHVHEILAPSRQDEVERARKEVEEAVKEKHAVGDPQVELLLYISNPSPSSLRALRNLRALLDDFDGARVRLSVCDLSREASPLAEEDRIAFTPTLVKRAPGPKVWILGDLKDSQIVYDLLQHAGVERAR